MVCLWLPLPLRCHLAPEPPPARALFPAHLHSDVRPRSCVEGRPHSPPQDGTAHPGSTARHMDPWSVHSTGRRSPHYTCSWPPETGCRSLVGQKAEPLRASGCLYTTDLSGMGTHGPESLESTKQSFFFFHYWFFLIIHDNRIHFDIVINA